MNAFGLTFMLATALALLCLPRHWALLPLLMGACYVTPAQNIMVGPFHFTVLRLLLLLGAIRAVLRGERITGELNALDWLILVWGVFDLCTGLFHKPLGDLLVYRLGIVYNTYGMYFLIRIYCQTTEELAQLMKLTAFLLVPVALEMFNEKLTGQNLFALLSGTPGDVLIRDGKLRANGPFGHAILAGTVGAFCAPLMIGIWRQHRLAALVGLSACVTMIAASTSSGPIMTLALSVVGLTMWRWRHLMSHIRIIIVVGYIVLDVLMKDPAYFLMARIDLTGSSTGWYRAELIRSSLAHLDEWWFVGTDYTRHWMPTGLFINNTECDIVNHFLAQGVSGGLMLMGLTVGWYWLGFRYVGRSLQLLADGAFSERFLMWSLGSSLFASAVTCFSVCYFDQSVMFLYLNLAAISSLQATALDQTYGADSAVISSDDSLMDGTSDGLPDYQSLACANN
jgi:hypothetical protein